MKFSFKKIVIEFLHVMTCVPSQLRHQFPLIVEVKHPGNELVSFLLLARC